MELDPAEAVYSFYLPDGTLLVEEQPEAVSHEEIHQGFLLEPGEAVYGLGQHRGSGLDQRRKNYHLENVNMEIAIPLFHSVKGYAVYWDNYSPTEFQGSEEGVSFSSEAGKNCSYFFLGGGSGDAVVRNIRALTGRVPMNPLWQFGFLQSRERYGSAEELVSIVKKYRELQVPLDGIVQDWQYWGDNAHWNAVEFLNPAYPDPKGMMDEIHGLHAHALISVWPSFGPESNIYKELQAENLLLGQSTFPQGNGVRVYDPWNPRAREIFWNYLEKNLWAAGVDGWWLDATEPEHQPVRPEDYDYRSPEGTYREMRNSFPLYTVGGVYDHQRALTSDRRVSILTRSAAAGLQRYGAHVWSGDLESTWTSLKEQVQEALNLSLCGIPFWNADIGGFFAGSWPGGNQNPGFRQLFGRWMQFAAFVRPLDAVRGLHGDDAFARDEHPAGDLPVRRSRRFGLRPAGKIHPAALPPAALYLQRRRGRDAGGRLPDAGPVHGLSGGQADLGRGHGVPVREVHPGRPGVHGGRHPEHLSPGREVDGVLGRQASERRRQLHSDFRPGRTAPVCEGRDDPAHGPGSAVCG